MHCLRTKGPYRNGFQLGTLALLAALCLPGLTQSGRSAEFRTVLPPDGERVWVGSDFFANRLLDWRLRDGRIECLRGSDRRPMRTLHVLTCVAGDRRGSYRLSVRTGPITAGGEPRLETWTGFLIGVGGDLIDYRISALCHHWPGEDGGLIAAVDGTGRVVFRDNGHLMGPRRPAPGIPLSAWPKLEPDEEIGPGFDGAVPEAMDLELRVEPAGAGYRATLTARRVDDGTLLHQASVSGLHRRQVSGNFALVSHQSRQLQGPGYWFQDLAASGTKLEAHPERAFGPILSAQYTLSGGTLKMTAQMVPLGRLDSGTAELQVRRGGGPWQTVSQAPVLRPSYTVPFRVEGWDATEAVPYRIVYRNRLDTGEEVVTFAGTIRQEPLDRDQFVLAAFTGHHISAQGQGNWNHGSFWYPHNELVSAVDFHDPDMLFFSGDQIYEGGLSGIVREPPEDAILDYLYHWYRWCLAFRDLTRDRPTVCLPDDHDVYHGNIWGSGGKPTTGPYGKPAQDSGGYQMHPLFVNAVHATQTSHFPDPVDPEPIQQGISVYFTRMEYGGLSFALIADRMWKSSPTVMVPEGNCINGWFEKPGFDPATGSDRPEALLLGPRQLAFLKDWTEDWSGGAEMKVLLSQTIFANVATLPAGAVNDTVVPGMRQAEAGEYLEGDAIVADADSNAWPQSGRRRALDTLRRGFAFHVAGDQHLGSFIQYGLDEWNDSSYAFCVPSIANVWPRRWFPPMPGANREEGAPRYTGEFLDGFGNRMTVHAVSNPGDSGQVPSALYDRAPGYGIVRFDRATRQITTECWPRWVDPRERDVAMYPGWPLTVNQLDQYRSHAAWYLPEIRVRGLARPVFQIVDDTDQTVVYTVRIRGDRFRPHVFGEGTYTVRIGDPDADRWHVLPNLAAESSPESRREVRIE